MMTPFLLFTLVLLETSMVSACSMLPPSEGDYYISNVDLLNSSVFPDSVLLTIVRTEASFADFTTESPWCKVMDVNTGSVNETIYNCSDYDSLLRDDADADTDPMSTTVSCSDNCDGSTATCAITRGGTTYDISTIPYNGSISANCISPSIDINTFTINTLNTTYIVFATTAVAVAFNDTSYTVYDVEMQGGLGLVLSHARLLRS